jgi:glycosyltransferase involved in cell wall biosynthesis
MAGPAAPPAVSVVLPVRNGAATLGRALDSLSAQTCREFEIVAVDDGSTDGTADILAAHARRDPRLAVVRPPSRPAWSPP